MATRTDTGIVNLAYDAESREVDAATKKSDEKSASKTTDDASDICDVNGTERNATGDPHPVTPSANAVDELQQHLGGYGRYQMVVFFLLSIIYMRGGWHVWISIYQGLAPSYHCSPTPGMGLNESVPWHTEDGTVVFSQCDQFVNSSVSNRTQPCTNGWTYLSDSSYTSIVSKYDLVCDGGYLNELTTTIYMVGSTCGVVFLMPLADKFGTKSVMLVSLWVQAVFATCIVWAGDIISFCVLKFFIGLFNMTIALCSFVLMSETFDATHREMPTIAMEFFWAFSIMSLALLGYLIPKWEDLQLAISLPVNILSLSFVFIIPSSLPWLLSKEKIKEARVVINRFLRVNKLPPIADLDRSLSEFQTEGKKLGVDHQLDHVKEVKEEVTGTDTGSTTYTVFTLFKTPKLRIHSIIMFYLYLVNSLAYFGIMYNTPSLNGDRFLNLFLLGLVEIPANVICMFANKIIGRRRSISIFLFICAASNLSVIFIPDQTEDGVDLTKLKTALVIIGKFGITGSYSAIYLFASEIFPTVLRNQAVGASSFFENIGSIAAPNMVYANNSLPNLPLGIFGGMTILGCGLVLLLPEVHNRPLPHTIEDVEGKRKNKKVVATKCTHDIDTMKDSY
ncbi:unnamed protein product [Lymnaea stagnalis]|uniref:Uncharacterized protein n=1 Tax=Lymnaea stagnalis TaxID=6523 RepID=A0AAV2IK97_LYMST